MYFYVFWDFIFFNVICIYVIWETTVLLATAAEAAPQSTHSGCLTANKLPHLIQFNFLQVHTVSYCASMKIAH